MFGIWKLEGTEIENLFLILALLAIIAVPVFLILSIVSLIKKKGKAKKFIKIGGISFAAAIVFMFIGGSIGEHNKDVAKEKKLEAYRQTPEYKAKIAKMKAEEAKKKAIAKAAHDKKAAEAKAAHDKKVAEAKAKKEAEKKAKAEAKKYAKWQKEFEDVGVPTNQAKGEVDSLKQYEKGLIAEGKSTEQVQTEVEKEKNHSLKIRKEAKEYTDWIDNHFTDGWSGAYSPDLEETVKSHMNDPSSFEHVETTYQNLGFKKGIKVHMVFRGTNAFGAVVTNYADATFLYGKDKFSYHINQ